VSSTVEGLDRGVVGTEATVKKMHKLVALGKLDPTFQKIATWIRAAVQGDQRGATAATADAIFRWVKKHGIFQRDPFQIEKIEHPIEAMRPIIEGRRAGTYRGPGLFVGDCDTFSIVTATLGGVLGFQYAFETAKVDPQRPDEFSHIWTSLLVDGDWRALDSSTRGATPGWRPPVEEKLFARWSEKPIESVVGKSEMSSFNNGLGDLVEDTGDVRSPLADVDTEYPKDYIGYGIPKDFGSGPGVIPPGNYEDLQLLVPHNTQIPSADLEPDMHMLKAAPTIDPSERIQSLYGQPDDHGNPYYRGTDTPTPHVKVEKFFYPPGSRWNAPYGHDDVRYVRTGAHIQVKSPETPERQVRVNMGQPMLARRTVMVTPRRMPFGTMEGTMGDIDPETGILTFGSTPTVAPTPAAASTPTTQAAATAGKSVWDSISDIASSVFKAAGAIVPATMQKKIAETVAKATNKVTGQTVVGVEQVSPWYTNPFVLGAGALILGGGAYIAMKSRPGSRGRRRR
jgi:hypothetical protein